MNQTFTPAETENAKADFAFDFGTFTSTTITVKAETLAGKTLFAEMFGAGAVSIELPKSKGEDLALFIERKGLKVS
jgi:hypothetical protein